MNPRLISIEDYSYHLPQENIAIYPLSKRDESKLLIYNNNDIKVSQYKNISQYLPQDCSLIFNNTKVVEARLYFKKETGGEIEIFCLEPANQYKDITEAMLSKQKVLWKCLVGGAKKWKDENLVLNVEHIKESFKLFAKKIEKQNDYFLIEFTWENIDLSFAEILHYAGEIPLPPYLNRNAEESDKKSYQTVYAKNDGSVAAPTAGLHFTKEVLNSLTEKKVHQKFVTLHVGAGTFKPVKAKTMQEHVMHSEFIEVEIDFIEHVINYHNKPIIAVGTTSLRTIESLYWFGIKANENKLHNEDSLVLNQWECYEMPQHYSIKEAYEFLLIWMKNNNVSKFIAKTQIIIAPGYELKVAQAIITNFHQPKSTLLLLIAAVVGNNWKKIYDYALLNNFRFLSYGDGSLLWK